MSEIPQPNNESLRTDVDAFVKQSNWVSETIALDLEEGTIDLDNYKSRIDLALRNPGVLLERANTLPGEIGGQLSEEQSAKIDLLNKKAGAILLLEGKEPDVLDANHLLMLPVLASREVTPQAAPYLAQIIREGNALVSDVVRTGRVEPNLTRYFASNITAIGQSIARTE